MSRRRKKNDDDHGEEHNDERWMASYMDMVTVLMCMFIVLFAMSTVDQTKFVQLKESLATGFGVTKTAYADVAKGIVVPKKDVGKQGELSNSQQSNSEKAIVELQKLEALRDAMQANLSQAGLASVVQFIIDSRGLTVRLDGAEAFFSTNSAVLSTTARQVLQNIAGPLNTVTYQIAIEGYADYRATIAPYPTNWELSSARAVSVLRDLVEQNAVASTRVGATGFGSARPLSTGTTPADLALNRRVDVVVLSDQSEAVRDLIPKLLAAQNAAAGTG